MDSFFKDTLPNNRAFSEMLRPAKEQVKHLSPDNIAQRSGAVFHESDGVLELQSLNQTVRITVPEYTFSPRLEEWHQLVILHYLALADGTAISDQVITFGGLKDGLIRGTKFDHDKGTSEISEWKNTGLHSEDLQSPWGRICRQQCRSVCSISLSAKLSGLVEDMVCG